MAKKKRKRYFKLVGSSTTQEAQAPKEEYEVSKETMSLLKTHGNKKEEISCYYGGRTSHQVHQLK